MIAMTFRVSEAESFRQWQRDEEASTELLIARLRGETPPTEAMRAGTAFHKALEVATAANHPSLTAEGYTFRFVGDFTLEVPTIREVRSSKTYRVGDFAVTITGQVDTIDGKRVDDHKTTGRFDPERYIGGYQWRFYLDIFGADVFRWNVFEIANHDDDPLMWDVYEAHRLEQFRYPDMEADCKRLAHDLAYFAKKNLPERIRREAVAA